MANNQEALTRVRHLRELARRIEADYATKKSVEELSDRVDEIATAGGEPNVITEIRVNGAAQPVSGKAVDITVPTQKDIADAVAAADHLQRKVVSGKEDIDPAADGADKYIYMVPKADAEEGDLYDEYMVLDGKVEHVGNTRIDLSGYVQKEAGMGLYPDADKAKLEGIVIATDEEVKEMLDEVFGAAQVEGE